MLSRFLLNSKPAHSGVVRDRPCAKLEEGKSILSILLVVVVVAAALSYTMRVFSRGKSKETRGGRVALQGMKTTHMLLRWNGCSANEDEYSSNVNPFDSTKESETVRVEKDVAIFFLSRVLWERNLSSLS